MSQQPFRITRVAKTPDRAPSSNPAASAVLSTACPRCGVYVADADLHAADHDRTDEWMQRVNTVLNDTMSLLLTREGVPTAGGTAASGGKCADRTTSQQAIKGDNQP